MDFSPTSGRPLTKTIVVLTPSNAFGYNMGIHVNVSSLDTLGMDLGAKLPIGDIHFKLLSLQLF